MKNSTIIALALLGLGYGVAARASDWQAIASTPERTIWMDMASMRRDGDALLAWFKQSYSANQKDNVGRAYRSSRELWAFKCATGQIAPLQMTEYSGASGEGKVVDSEARDMVIAQWTYAAPDTVGEFLLQSACKQATNPKSSN
jgi:hypothetical protein